MSSGRLVQYRNCRLLRDHKLVWDDLWVRGGRIEDPRQLFWEERVSSDIQVDCGGCIISPGFIDVQINGGFGVDFSSRTDDIVASIELVSREMLAHGVTAFCPTIVSSGPEVYRKISSECSKLCNQSQSNGATVLGLHLEGPFISKEKRGAHPVDVIRSFDKDGFNDMLRMYTSLENIAIVTLAPELPHSDEVIKELTGRGVKVSVGHSMANLEESERAVECGATFITHLFNAMLPFHHRDPGIVGLLASDKIPAGTTVYYGIISDGIHTNPSAVRIAYKTHPQGAVLITDAVAPMGLSEGTYTFGGAINVNVTSDGRAFVVGTNTLAGSVATMDHCVRTFRSSARCSTESALEAATLHPARMLGIENERGTLNYGSIADFIMLDDDLHVLATYIAGNKVYSKTTGLLVSRDSSGESLAFKRLRNGGVVKACT